MRPFQAQKLAQTRVAAQHTALLPAKKSYKIEGVKEYSGQPNLSRLRIGFIIGLLCNGIFIVKALPYLFLPVGSVIGPDTFLNQIYPYAVLFSIFVGVPIALWDASRNRGKRFNIPITIFSVVLCLSTFQTPLKLQQIIGDARQIKTPCYPCDGPSPMEGLYLVY